MREPIMEGGGYYNRHSQLQAGSAKTADGVLQRALAAVAIPSGPITIADFGSSQGQNSLHPMALAIDTLRQRDGQNRDIMVVHTDLPHNDFNSLFDTLRTAPNSYQNGRPHVFAAAIGHSFYDRLLPANSLTFGWSAFALHWLSTAPPLRAHIWPIFAQPDEAATLAAVAAGDWRNFLANRAAELAPSGQLVLVIGALNEAGASGLEPMMELANQVLKGLVAGGKLDPIAHAAMSIAARPRSHAEFTAPFDNGDLPGLSLEEMIISDTPNAALLGWQKTADSAVLAAEINSFFIAAFGPSLFGGDAQLRDLFASRFTAAIARAPAELTKPLCTATLRIVRRT